MNDTVVLRMPNEGQIGGFEIRRFIQKYLRVGLVISVSFHALAIGAYYFAVYLASREVPPPVRVVYRNITELGVPPSISGEKPPPMLKIALLKLALRAAIPKPVPEEMAPNEQLIPNQAEIKEYFNARMDSAVRGDLSMEGVEIKPEILMEEEPPPPDKYISYEQTPQIVKRVNPTYPDIARSAEVGGKVVVQFFVDKKGNVKNAKAVKADPKGLGFEEAAVEAIMQWKFTPALQRENPVGVWVSQTITFEIK